MFSYLPLVSMPTHLPPTSVLKEKIIGAALVLLPGLNFPADSLAFRGAEKA